MIRLLLAASLLVGGAPLPALAAAKYPDTYTYLTIAEADSLDNAWSYDVSSHMLILNIYETLFQFEGSSTEKLTPLIAEKVPSRANGLISADGRTYTIPIRKGIKFHDGSPLTAEDVQYSLQRFMLQDRAAGPSPLLLEPLVGYPNTRDEKGAILPQVWGDVQKAVTVSNGSVVLKLPRPYAPLLSILVSWAPVLPKAWATANGDWDGTEATWKKYNNPNKQSSPFFERANGTGAFKLERWDRKTKEVILVRNEGYWRKPARLKTVVVKAVSEFGTRKLMLAAGDADNIWADRPLQSQLTGIPGVKIVDNLPVADMNPVIFFTYHVNAAGNPNIGSGKLDGNGIPADFFSDKDVRRAFAYAFDYKGYISDVFRGKGTQATGVIPKILPGHDASGKTYVFDMKKAAEHLKKARGGQVWEKGFRFTMAYNTGNLPRQTICQILKRNIESLNPGKFKVDVRAVEWPTFLDNYKGSKLPIFVMGWNADYPDAHNFTFTFLHSKGDYPGTQKFGDPAFDKLVEEGKVATDPVKRKAIYRKLQDLAYEEVPQLYVLDTMLYRTQRDWVKGWTYNPIFPDAPYGSYYYPMWKE